VLAASTSLAIPALAAPRAAAHQATDIRLGTLGDATRVVVQFSSAPTYSARLERDGTRLVIDVADAGLAGAPTAITEPTGLVTGVLAQSFTGEDASTARLLISLKEKADYTLRLEGNQLVVTLTKGSTGAADRAAGAPAVAQPEAHAAELQDVRFQHGARADEVQIALSEIPKYRLVKLGAGRSRLVLDATEMPKALERVLDVTAFDGRVERITSRVSATESGRAVIDVERRGGAEESVERRGNMLVWTFREPGAVTPAESGIASDGGIARRTRTVSVEETPEGVPTVQTSVSTDAVVETASEGDQVGAYSPPILGQAQRFTGRRVDLDLKDADVHNVLRLLADVGRINIITADNVSGTVTLRMRNVPWDQALDVVLQSKKLGMVQQGNLIRVAPLADLEKEREMTIARMKQEVQLAPVETRLIPVSYAQAQEIQARAKELLSERGSIAVDERTNVMIARDLAGNLNQIEELVRALDTQTPQVLIEARIVEATSRYLRDVGIQWGGDGTFSAATGNPTGLAFPNSVAVAGGASDGNAPTAGLSPFSNSVATPNYVVNLPAAVGTGQGGAIGLSFGSIDNTINLGLRLSAAESSGMLRILSSPRILTLDNREARISQGTLIPFSQVSAQGVQTTFQEAKLQLLVKPHVTADGSVAMRVKINRDEPDFNQTSARGDPTILKREAETELLVMDGHTAVIGGIYTRNSGRNLDQVPFFGDIPLLGLLFQRRRASDQRGELVIFITPRIVNRAEALGR